MNQNFFIIKTAFILLLCGYLSNTHAGRSAISCSFKMDQQYLGALPEFSSDSAPLQGYQCQHSPYYSSFLGNWFPSLPSLSFGRSSRSLTSNNNSSDTGSNDDSSQAWNVAFSIKRIGQSQLSIFSGQKDWEKRMQAKEAITFIPSNAQSENDGITINTGQQAQLNRTENYFGMSLIFPYRYEETLTELRLQRAIINQPIQANVPLFENRSLFFSQTTVDEIIIISQSHHKGLNINWQFSLGQGDIILKPQDIIQFDSELNQIISLRGQLELYYQYRLNRRWFSHIGWQGDIHYWQQNTNNNDFQLASASTMEQQVFLGIGLTF